MTDSLPSAAGAATPAGSAAPGVRPWVVLPTYNEIENIDSISAAILAALPAATLLVVGVATGACFTGTRVPVGWALGERHMPSALLAACE